MPEPISIDIPHSLGRDAARVKLDHGIGQIAGVIPGGSLKAHRWQGDMLFSEIEAMGQRVAAQIEVFETRIHALVDLRSLPPSSPKRSKANSPRLAQNFFARRTARQKDQRVNALVTKSQPSFIPMGSTL